MKLIDKHKQLIVWYKKKLGLTDYGFMCLAFLKGLFVVLVIEKIDFSQDV
tara:strand:+ start:25 stop:174 length:150 start_codon:yes stop_codon:yes gene_type:complete